MQLLTLEFPENKAVVTLFQDPETQVNWFHTHDVEKALEITTLRRSLSLLLQKHEYREVRFPGQVGRPAIYVREEALYLLLMRSNSVKAEAFQRWLAYEVLLSIRKTGEYKATAADQQHFSPFGLTVQIATVEEAQGKNQLALQNAEPGTGQVLTLVKESAALRQEKLALDRLLKATPTKEAVDRDQAIENHILERLGRFPEGIAVSTLVNSKFLFNRKAKSKKVILPVLQKLRSQGRCEEIFPNTWKLTGDLS